MARIRNAARQNNPPAAAAAAHRPASAPALLPRRDYNQKHFVRNEGFSEAADAIQGDLRKIFIEFLERSCTAGAWAAVLGCWPAAAA